MSRPFTAEYLVDRHVAGGDGDRLAIRTMGRSITYGELQRLVRGAAAGLSGLGVRREERVLLVLLDGPEFVAAFLGAMWLGAVPVLVNPLLPGRDLALPARDSRARSSPRSGRRWRAISRRARRSSPT